MHMADALISPAVGGSMWAAAAGAILFCSGRLTRQLDDRKIPLMGVLGAFIFAAQMINFTIPGTGSSGHLGGGMILAILLGPAAGFITMASVLTVQALFFADGGLLALGSNIVNLGAITCFIAYPFVFQPLAGPAPGRLRLVLACLFSAVAGLQLGSFGVVAQTSLSGVADLSFGTFLMLMQPIHLAIGVVEGAVTAVVVSFILKARPQVLELITHPGRVRGLCCRQILVPVFVVTLVCGGLISGFASARPDGLEWSLEQAAAREPGGDSPGVSHSVASRLQKRTAFLPDYDFRPQSAATKHGSGSQEPSPGGLHAGTSISGLLGGVLTLLLILLGGGLVRLWQKRPVTSE